MSYYCDFKFNFKLTYLLPSSNIGFAVPYLANQHDAIYANNVSFFQHYLLHYEIVILIYILGICEA